MAELAHGLINSVSAIKGAAEVLQKQGVGAMAINDQCLTIIIEQSRAIADVLHELMGSLGSD